MPARCNTLPPTVTLCCKTQHLQPLLQNTIPATTCCQNANCSTPLPTPTATHRSQHQLQHFVANSTATPTLQVTTWLPYNHHSPHWFHQTTSVRAGLSFGRPIYLLLPNVIHLTTVSNTYVYSYLLWSSTLYYLLYTHYPVIHPNTHTHSHTSTSSSREAPVPSDRATASGHPAPTHSPFPLATTTS